MCREPDRGMSGGWVRAGFSEEENSILSWGP